MATTLTTVVPDQSTIKITCAFTDAAGSAVTPDSIVWTLADRAGTVINSRSDVAVVTPAASIDIVLSGADNKYSDGAERELTVEAVYDSDEGSNLPLNGRAHYRIEDPDDV